MKGIVFDIQRFALHDGPGIRTVVFLKGCPFRCVWCCNPESISPKPQFAYIDGKCEQHEQCVSACNTGALSLVNGEMQVKFDLCIACGDCIEDCPSRALKIYGYEMDAEQVIEEVLKDVDYYGNSGGGLTLSGGDPLFQFNFALEILKLAKQKGLNTCIESEGFGKKHQLLMVLPLIDYFYLDYKITDPADHERYTSQSRDIVIGNLDLIANNHPHITLRCIIIPGINDNDEHFRAIAELSNQYPSVRGVEIMPYHVFGQGKYKEIGRPLFPIEAGSVSPELANSWIHRIHAFGAKNTK